MATTSKGQVTLPRAIRDKLHLNAGDRFEVELTADGLICEVAWVLQRAYGLSRQVLVFALRQLVETTVVFERRDLFTAALDRFTEAAGPLRGPTDPSAGCGGRRPCGRDP